MKSVGVVTNKGPAGRAAASSAAHEHPPSRRSREDARRPGSLVEAKEPQTGLWTFFSIGRAVAYVPRASSVSRTLATMLAASSPASASWPAGVP